MMMIVIMIVVLLGLINHEPKTVLCKVQGGVILCVLLVAHFLCMFCSFICIYVKQVKQSCYRPGVAQRVPGS